jgi:hypothetical protein
MVWPGIGKIQMEGVVLERKFHIIPSGKLGVQVSKELYLLSCFF